MRARRDFTDFPSEVVPRERPRLRRLDQVSRFDPCRGALIDEDSRAADGGGRNFTHRGTEGADGVDVRPVGDALVAIG